MNTEKILKRMEVITKSFSDLNTVLDAAIADDDPVIIAMISLQVKMLHDKTGAYVERQMERIKTEGQSTELKS